MGRLGGKVAFLTGAGAGIAKATANAYVREGGKVVIAEIDREAGQAAAREILRAGGEAIFVETDVTQEDSIRSAIDAAVARFGRLDIVMTCAGGSYQEDVPVHEMDLAVWWKTITVNLLHPFLCCRYALPHMMEGGGGSIINLASHFGLVGSGKPAYSAAKGGIVAFTRTLAAQYADYNIRANAIAPGAVRTERWIERWENPRLHDGASASAAQRSRSAKQKLYPFSVSEVGQIAELAVFLGCDESRMITGTTIAADGGQSSYLRVGA